MQIIANNEVKTISSLKIAELADKRHDHVMRDIRKMLDALIASGHIADEGLPKFEASYLNTQGKEQPCFELPLRLAKTLLVKYDTVRAYRVLEYIDALEAKVASLTPIVPQSLPEALRLYADEVEKREAAQKQLTEQAPMVEFAEAVMANGQDLSLTAAGKELGYGQKEWFAFLRANKLIAKRTYHPSRNRPAEFNEASAGMVAANYMVVRHEVDVKGIPRPQTFVTSTGLDWLRRLAANKKAA